MRRRLFTLAEANSLLGWLAEQFAQANALSEELLRQQRRLQGQRQGLSRNGGSEHVDELTSAQRQIEKLERQLVQLVQGIQGRGIEVRDVRRGLVDFPSMREGEEVHLCWLRGEPEIGYWHSLDTGFASRQPL